MLSPTTTDNLLPIGSGQTLTVKYGGSGSLTASQGMVVVTLTKADPVVTWPTELTATYGQTLSAIALPGNGTSTQGGIFTWTAPDDVVGNAGSVTHNMTFAPTDDAHYNTLTHGAAVTVTKANQATLTITELDGPFVYGGSALLGTTGGTTSGAVTYTSSDTAVVPLQEAR